MDAQAAGPAINLYAIGQRSERPWGTWEVLDAGLGFAVKRITVNVRQKLSLQKHYHRAEHWVVVTGTALVTRDAEQLLLREKESIHIPVGTAHRVENPGVIPMIMIEVQVGSYLSEDDIVRLDDMYGRASDAPESSAALPR